MTDSDTAVPVATGQSTAAGSTLYLGLRDEFRAWKSVDWDATDCLHGMDLLADPCNNAKSVVITDEGLRAAKEAFARSFGEEG